jgi:hypothetical protein
MKKATREWVRKAEADYQLAAKLEREKEPFYDHRCFLLVHYPQMRGLRRGLRFLTDFAVEPRYPGEWTTKRQAISALRWAGRVRDACRRLLGLLPPGTRRHS